MSRKRDEALTTLDDLFSTLESMQLRVLETLGDELVDEPLVAGDEPMLDLDTILFAAVDAAVELDGADGALATTFADGGLYAANGLTDEEAVTYAVGPPPVGPSVRALAIAYEGEGVQMGLAVPILSADQTIGFLSVYTRSPAVVFDEEQGRFLQEIAAAAAVRIEELFGPAPAPVTAAEPEPEPEADTQIAAAPRVLRSRPRLALLSLAAVACVAAPLLMAAGIHSGLRVAAALVLMTLAPGAAAWPLFGSRRPELELGLVVGTSIGVSVLVAEVTLWAGLWSPQRSTTALALVSLVSILAQLGRQVVPPRVSWSAS